MRHRKVGSQVKPLSSSTTLRSGCSEKTPSVSRLASCASKAWAPTTWSSRCVLGQPVGVVAWRFSPPAWMPSGRPYRAAAACSGHQCRRPSGWSSMDSTSTCTKRRSAAQRSTSATASATFWVGTRMLARRRSSRLSHSAATQSLTARQSAAAMSSVCSATAPCRQWPMAMAVPMGSSTWRCSRLSASSPLAGRQSGRQASGVRLAEVVRVKSAPTRPRTMNCSRQ